MDRTQQGILEPVPQHARYLFFDIIPGSDVLPALERLLSLVDGNEIIIGVGQSLISMLGLSIPGLRSFPCWPGPASRCLQLQRLYGVGFAARTEVI
jgi:putative iron-dependent peroxidase